MTGALLTEPAALKNLVRRARVPRRKRRLQCHGRFAGRGVLVFGRTGAGKSSLINVLSGHEVVPVGDIGSTTRDIYGACYTRHGVVTTLIDTPGIGEVGTDQDYLTGMLDWLGWQMRRPDLMLLVLQADMKAYADEECFLSEMRNACPGTPVLVIVNQVDKMKPTREPLPAGTWPVMSTLTTTKAENIVAKLALVAKQFGLCANEVLPFSAESDAVFNLPALEGAIAERLDSCAGGMFAKDVIGTNLLNQRH